MDPTKLATREAPKRPDIKAVAQHANVSVATVSRTMRNPEVVALKTRKRVETAMEDLGYKPNIQARNLRTARTGLIVVLVTNIANPFFSEVIRGIEHVAHENGYSILLGDVLESHSREKAYFELMTSGQADGLISLLPHAPAQNLIGTLPIVTSCAEMSDPRVSSVFIDNERAAHGATDYLLSLGHRAIGCITGWANSPNSKSREKGYRAAILAAGLQIRQELIAAGEFNVESGYRGAERLLILNPDITAIFCCSDEMALGAIKAVKARGLKVPEDVSVVGFDGIHFAQYFDPPLTTVATPMRELGEEPMRMLLELLRDPVAPPRKRMLPTSLVIRESAAPMRIKQLRK